MISVLVYVFMTSYLWFGFPFHNVCEYDGDDSMDLLSAYVGEHKISGHTFNVSNDDTVYKYCSQDLIRSSFKFPSLSKYQPEPGWMSPDVARIVDIFAWTSIAVLIVALLFLLKVVPRKVYGFFYSIYKVCQQKRSFEIYFDILYVTPTSYSFSILLAFWKNRQRVF